MKTILVVRDGKVVELSEKPSNYEERAFHISVKGSGGLKWLNKSANKTWINNGKVYRAKQGDPTNLK